MMISRTHRDTLCKSPMLSEKAIKEYKEVYKEQFGVELSGEEAREQAERLMRLFKAIAKPIPKTA